MPQCVLALVLAKEQPLGNTGALSITNHRDEGAEKVIAAYRLLKTTSLPRDWKMYNTMQMREVKSEICRELL